MTTRNDLLVRIAEKVGDTTGIKDYGQNCLLALISGYLGGILTKKASRNELLKEIADLNGSLTTSANDPRNALIHKAIIAINPAYIPTGHDRNSLLSDLLNEISPHILEGLYQFQNGDNYNFQDDQPFQFN